MGSEDAGGQASEKAADKASEKAAEKASEAAHETQEFLAIEVDNIIQEYARPEGGEALRVIDGISLRFDKPSINMLLGPSGCGKSTLLRMMGGVRPLNVVTPTKGKITIGGKPCDGPHEDSVMVFQRYANRPDLSVEENVAFPFRFGVWKRRVDRAQQSTRVTNMLELVGLSDKNKLRPSQLSGGQNQRVALARALVLKPRILLMDEPFAALDAQTREEMQRLLASIFETQKCLIVFVTHDVSEALSLGDRILVMSASPAKIVDDIVLDEPRPRSDAWMMSSQITQLKDRIIAKLHSGAGRGQVRVSI